MSFTVYGLFDERDPGRLRYIGFSRNPERRLGHHLAEAQASRARSHRLAWLRKVAAAGARVLWRSLQIVDTADEAALAEVAIIARLRKSGANLVNGTVGGEGVQGHGGKLAPEALARRVASQNTPEYLQLRSSHSRRYWASTDTRQQHREMMKAFWASPAGAKLREANREQARAQMTGVKRGAESRAKMRAAKLGKPQRPRTPEWREKIAAAQRGKPRKPWTPEERARRMASLQSPETRAKMSASAKRRWAA